MRRLLKSLQGRVLVALILLAMIPLFIVAAQGYHCARQAVEDLVRMHLVSLVKGRQALLDEWFSERQQDLAAAATLPPMAEAVRALQSEDAEEAATRAASLLQHVHETAPAFESLALYDADWNPLLAVGQGIEAHGVPVPAEVRELSRPAAEVFFGKPHLEASDTVSSHIGHSIHDNDGQRIGYMVGNLNLTKELAPLLQKRSGLLSTGKTYLVSSGLDIISEPFEVNGGVAFHKKAPPAVRNAAERGAPAIQQYLDYRGVPVLGTAAPLPVQDWILAAEIDRDEALEWLDRLIFRALVTIAVTLAAVILMSMWLSRLLGKPLREIAAVAHRIRLGSTRERAPTSSITETAEVVQAFNQMLDVLHEQQDRLVKTATLANIGQITSSIVHEMRNPLSTIKMNLRSISAVIPRENRRYELAQIASAQLGRIDRMLTDLLQFGRPLELHRKPMSFAELAHLSIDVAADEIQTKRMQVELEDETDGVLLNVDREQACRALSNLILNAVQAAPEGSAILLRGIAVEGASQRLEISVIDEGPGLPEKAQEKLFSPFFTTKASGTGLGLANVKKVVELHGGAVAAENTAEGGACFRMTLPALRVKAPVLA